MYFSGKVQLYSHVVPRISCHVGSVSKQKKNIENLYKVTPKMSSWCQVIRESMTFKSGDLSTLNHPKIVFLSKYCIFIYFFLKYLLKRSSVDMLR